MAAVHREHPAAALTGQRGVIDRIEGEQAVIVLEDGQRMLWPAGELPDGAAEGVAVVLTLALATDAETQRRRDQVAVLQERLLGRDKS
jgi:hypothetical protein